MQVKVAPTHEIDTSPAAPLLASAAGAAEP
jgi:hypothetical protein